MRNYKSSFTLSFILMIISITIVSCQNSNPKVIPSKKAIDKYHGQNIEDPYRNIEDLNDTIVLDWFKSESAYTQNQLDKIKGRKDIIEYQKGLDQKKTVDIKDVKITTDDTYFYLKSTYNDNTPKLYFKKESSGMESLLFDPENYKKGKEDYLISFFEPDWDGKNIAIALTKEGKEIADIVIVNCEKKEIIAGPFPNSWPDSLGGIQWTSDNSSIIYTYIPDINPDSKSFLLNTEAILVAISKESTTQKVLLSKEENSEFDIAKEDFPILNIEQKGSKYVFAELGGASIYFESFYTQTEKLDDKPNWKSLFSKNEKITRYRSKGDTLVYLTSKNESNFEIRSVLIENPDFTNSKIIVPAFTDEVINDFLLLNNEIYFTTTKNGVSTSFYKVGNTKVKKIPLPGSFGSIRISSKKGLSNKIWLKAKGWLTPENRYVFDTKTLKFEEENLSTKTEYTDFKDFIVKEIVVKSHDGMEIPLSLVYKKGIELNGKNPVLLRGYGSYGIPFSPYFSPKILYWVKKGGIFATPHVRGGGEKGENWHKLGFKETKPNTWKDLISCTEYLIKNNYTSPQKTAIWSGSAGGILIGRAITERPDLFGVAVVESGAFNMIRSEIQPNGANNTKEFGTVENENEFKALLEMDSYHHIVKNTKYPSTLITAGINDPRVVAWDPAKFAARLKNANSSNNPILLSVDFSGGHGLNSQKDKAFNKLANVFSFMLWRTGHPDFQPKN